MMSGGEMIRTVEQNGEAGLIDIFPTAVCFLSRLFLLAAFVSLQALSFDRVLLRSQWVSPSYGGAGVAGS